MADRRAKAEARRAALQGEGSTIEAALATEPPQATMKPTEPIETSPKLKPSPKPPEPTVAPIKRITVDLSTAHHRRLRGLALDLDCSGSDVMRAMLDGLSDTQVAKLVNDWRKSNRQR